MGASLTIGTSQCGDLLTFVVGLGFLGAGISLLRVSLRYQREGIITEGQVVAIHSSRGKGDVHHHPIVRFTEQSQATTIEFTDMTEPSSEPI